MVLCGRQKESEFGCRAVLGSQAIFYAAVGAANIRKHAADVKEESDAHWLDTPPVPPPEANVGMSPTLIKHSKFRPHSNDAMPLTPGTLAPGSESLFPTP